MPQAYKMPYIGYLTVRKRSLLHQHMSRHLKHDGSKQIVMLGCITCNLAISGPRYKDEPIIAGESSLWTPFQRQVNCFPGARVWQATIEAGELHGRPSYYVSYSDPVSEEAIIKEFLRKAYRRPRNVEPLVIDANPPTAHYQAETKILPRNRKK